MRELGIFLPDGSFRSKQDIIAKLAKDYCLSVEKPDAIKPISFAQHLSRIEAIRDLRKETALWKDEVEIKIDTGRMPYFFMRPLADMHLGGMGVDMEAVRSNLQDLRALPITTTLQGDLGNFFAPMKHPEGMMGDAVTPDDQLSMIRRFFEEYQDKILATVQDPSHTDWIRQLAGIEPQRYITENLQIPALKNGGVMHLNVNGIEYNGLLFHQIGQYKSSLNITNAGKRMLDMAGDADFVVSGHTHIGAMEKLVKRDKKPVIIQLGTFKTEDDFGTRLGLSPNPQVFFPTIVFGSKRKSIEVIEDREVAGDFIRALMSN